MRPYRGGRPEDEDFTAPARRLRLPQERRRVFLNQSQMANRELVFALSGDPLLEIIEQQMIPADD